MKKILPFTLLFFILIFFQFNSLSSFRAEKKYTLSEYIEYFKPIAIKDMNRSGIPASITLSQAILESGYGNSALAIYANNHFGMKNKPEWQGKTYYIGSTCYKKYNSALESYEDHSKHIKSRKWYTSLFSLNITDYKKWAHGLKKAGYAQDPYYAYRLIQIIDKYKFHSLDSLYNPADTILSK